MENVRTKMWKIAAPPIFRRSLCRVARIVFFKRGSNARKREHNESSTQPQHFARETLGRFIFDSMYFASFLSFLYVCSGRVHFPRVHVRHHRFFSDSGCTSLSDARKYTGGSRRYFSGENNSRISSIKRFVLFFPMTRESLQRPLQNIVYSAVTNIYFGLLWNEIWWMFVHTVRMELFSTPQM